MVDIVVLPMGLQNPFSIFSPLTLPLRTLYSVQQLAVFVYKYSWPLYLSGSGRASQETPVSMYFLASKIVYRFGDCIWNESPGWAVSG